MNKQSRQRITDYLEQVLQAITRIERYLDNIEFNVFLVNEEKQDAIIRNLEIIGEAAANLIRNYPEFTESHSELPWKHAYGMRNALSHGYFKVDVEVVWTTTQKDLPALKLQLKDILKSLNSAHQENK